MENSTTKPFYNTTIPSDWAEVRIKDIGKITSGTTPLRSNMAYHTNGIIPWVKTTDLNNSIIVYTEEKISELALKETSLRIYPKDTILVAMYGGFNQIGRTGILGIGATINQALSAISVDKNEIDPIFLLNWLNAKVGLWKNLAGSSRKDPNITSKDVGDFPFIKIPLPEQRAIAHVLSLMDTAINQNNQLIAQKELRKKWLMQNLLTGKKRLKGFGGEWKEIHIKDVSKEVSIRNKTDKQLTVLSCTKYDGLVESLEYWGRKIFADDISTYKIVPKNHFAYATNHIEEGSIGYQDSFDEALISPMYTVFKTDSSINDLYFYKLLKSHMLIYQYQNRMEGSIDRRGGLRWDAFSIIKIHIPSYEEQTAITQVLQAADKEIQLLKAKTDKLRKQKKGMMQQLLTGKKRLIK